MTGEKRLVLIVEDDPNNAKLAKDLFELRGHTVIAAGTVADGIAMAQERLPDVIVMDFQLPDKNGLEAHALLKKDERTKNIPIVFVTASVTIIEKQLMDATRSLVIAKPINTRTFVDRILEGAV